MHVDELDYALPEELIAQEPSVQRDQSRLMVLDRASGSIQCDVFANLPGYLRAGDLVVLNDTRVLRARLLGNKHTGGRVEIFLLEQEGAGHWRALVRPSAKVRPGTRVRVGSHEVQVGEVLPEGQRRVTFDTPDVLSLLEETGEIPLPPYIRREQQRDSDLRRYQTVYARTAGAVAAPTAGLHYTPDVFAALESRGIGRAFLTLHVGYGTFKGISADTLEAHRVDAEEFELNDATAAQLNAARAAGGRIVAAGTTTARVLETQVHEGVFQAGRGRTDKYIYPPYVFQGVDILQTNFHLPKSSLLALVYAFAGAEFVRTAYRRAIEERFRFYSYGDTMLIL